MRLHNLGGVRLQDRTEVIADELVSVADAVAARQIRDRARARNRRLEVGPCKMRPNAREVWDGCAFFAYRREAEQHRRDQTAYQPLHFKMRREAGHRCFLLKRCDRTSYTSGPCFPRAHCERVCFRGILRHHFGGKMRFTIVAAAAASVAMSAAYAASSYEGDGKVPEQFVVSGKAADRLHDHVSINLATAEKLVAACQASARKINSAVVVVVLDPQGLPVLESRGDGE